MENKLPIKKVEIEKGMTGIDAIEKLLGINVHQADDIAVVTIPMKETGKDEAFVVLKNGSAGICIHLNALLGFVGSVSIIPHVKEPDGKDVKNYVR